MENKDSYRWEFIIVWVVLLLGLGIGLDIYFSNRKISDSPDNQNTEYNSSSPQYSNTALPSPTPYSSYNYNNGINTPSSSASGSGEIKVISPNGGEKLCFEEPYTIKWESKGTELFTLSVLEIVCTRI